MGKDNAKLYRAFQDKMAKLKEETGRDPECRNTHDVFFPDEYDLKTRHIAVVTAKAICLRCPLLTDCALYAIESEQTYGIWGSQTPEERLEFIRGVKKFSRRRKS